MKKKSSIKKEKWYLYDQEMLFLKLQTSTNGLSEEESQKRLDIYGPNKLPTKPSPLAVQIFLKQFISPLIYILLAAGTITLFLGDYKDSIFIFGIILLNASLGTFQEWKAEKNAESLQKLLHIFVTIKRDNQIKEVYSDNLVPGDLVFLESGQKVPADIRLLFSKNLEVDESFLTGESDTVNKTSDNITSDNNRFVDQKNMVFAGSTVMNGRCNGIVVETGTRTVVGEIADSLTFEEGSKPPLIIKMERFAKFISLFVFGAIIVFGLVSYLNGMSLRDIFFLSVALAVSAIPEGLPIAMTVTLSIASKRMANNNVIIRNLVSVESLGSCTMIASDKTGTLTVNRQTLTKMVLPWNESIEITGEGYEPEGEVVTDNREEILKIMNRIAEVSTLCNEATLKEENENWVYQGDVMDIAFLTFAYKLNNKFKYIKENVEVLETIPFESENMFAGIKYLYDDSIKFGVKGAVEKIMDFCNTMVDENGNAVPINKSDIESQTMKMTKKGYRVLALAAQSLTSIDTDFPLAVDQLESMTFLGLACFIDPLRAESQSSIQKAREAGIRVAMVTGDHPSTAFTIAQELGLAETMDQTITGKQLEEYENTLSEEDFVDKISGVKVFARVAPMQKLKIVETMLSAGHLIAVTGDGVNDAPAMKKANIGVAMGSGSDIAKDTASIIIVDDNFSSIVKGIEEGRYAYSNVRKVIYLLIATGFAELVLFLLSILFNTPLPLLPVQILWLNLVTNGIQDVALGFEAGDPFEMRRNPRKTSKGIIDSLMVQQTLVSGLTIALISFFVWFYLISMGFQLDESRNIVLILMVLLENIHALNCRSERRSVFRIPIKNNYILIFGILCAQAIHLICMHIPIMQDVLSINPISFALWGQLLLFAIILLVVMEGFKLVRRFVGRR